MNDELFSSIYNGVTFLQMVLFSLMILSVTFREESQEKIRVKSILQGGCIVLAAFFVGIASRYLWTAFAVFVNSRAEHLDGVAQQMLFTPATAVNAVLNCIPTAIVSVSIWIFHKEHRKLRVFTAVLFLLVEIFLLELFSGFTNIFFSQGESGGYRLDPPYWVCTLINFAWLIAAFFCTGNICGINWYILCLMRRSRSAVLFWCRYCLILCWNSRFIT